MPMKDPWGRQIYWIGGGEISWSGEPDSDFRAIEEGYVSVTPLHLDLTHFGVFQGAKDVVARPVDAEFRGARLRLVETLREKGIRDLAVLRAFEMTPRHAFVPTGIRHRAYEDTPLPIGNGQTISQPWVHARYLELLHFSGRERVLEIGTGSGYQTVLLAHLVAQVFSIERIPALMQQARENIQRTGVNNVSLLLGDGKHRVARVRAVRRDSRQRRRAVDSAAAARPARRGRSAARSRSATAKSRSSSSPSAGKGRSSCTKKRPCASCRSSGITVGG